MAVSLYDVTVGAFLQTVGAVQGVLQRGLDHCEENNLDPNDIIETRLFEDMLPFRFQVQSVAHHSLGAIEGVKAGIFSPPQTLGPESYTGLQALVNETLDGLRALTPAEVNALEGKDMTFQMRQVTLPFTAENFLMTFSLPNFYFHAATTYDILRMKGAPLGKRDFMGQMRVKT